MTEAKELVEQRLADCKCGNGSGSAHAANIEHSTQQEHESESESELESWKELVNIQVNAARLARVAQTATTAAAAAAADAVTAAKSNSSNTSKFKRSKSRAQKKAHTETVDENEVENEVENQDENNNADRAKSSSAKPNRNAAANIRRVHFSAEDSSNSGQDQEGAATSDEDAVREKVSKRKPKPKLTVNGLFVLVFVLCFHAYYWGGATSANGGLL